MYSIFSHRTPNSWGVLIAYLDFKSFIAARILILELTIDNADYILINIYNTNSEAKQLQVHLNFQLLLDSLNIYHNKQ